MRLLKSASPSPLLSLENTIASDLKQMRRRQLEKLLRQENFKAKSAKALELAGAKAERKTQLLREQVEHLQEANLKRRQRFLAKSQSLKEADVVGRKKLQQKLDKALKKASHRLVEASKFSHSQERSLRLQARLESMQEKQEVEEARLKEKVERRLETIEKKLAKSGELHMRRLQEKAEVAAKHFSNLQNVSERRRSADSSRYSELERKFIEKSSRLNKVRQLKLQSSLAYRNLSAASSPKTLSRDQKIMSRVSLLERQLKAKERDANAVKDLIRAQTAKRIDQQRFQAEEARERRLTLEDERLEKHQYKLDDLHQQLIESSKRQQSEEALLAKRQELAIRAMMERERIWRDLGLLQQAPYSSEAKRMKKELEELSHSDGNMVKIHG